MLTPTTRDDVRGRDPTTLWGKRMALTRLLVSDCKPLIVVIHLPRLLQRDPDYVIDYAVSEAKTVEEAGADAIIVENYGDTPYVRNRLSRLELAVLTAVVREVVKTVSLPVGVNALRNAAVDALAAAYAGNASFIRVNSYCELREAPEGLLQPIARKLELLRKSLPRRIEVLADIDVKHSYPLVNEYDAATRLRECVERGQPDAVIVTGHATGEAPPPGYVAALREAAKPLPILLGSGLSTENIKLYWSLVDGFIVGTSVKKNRTTVNRVDSALLKKLVETKKKLGGQC